MFGNISVGVRRMTTGVIKSSKSDRTINVYGRESASLTIHIISEEHSSIRSPNVEIPARPVVYAHLKPFAPPLFPMNGIGVSQGRQRIPLFRHSLPAYRNEPTRRNKRSAEGRQA